MGPVFDRTDRGSCQTCYVTKREVLVLDPIAEDCLAVDAPPS